MRVSRRVTPFERPGKVKLTPGPFVSEGLIEGLAPGYCRNGFFANLATALPNTLPLSQRKSFSDFDKLTNEKPHVGYSRRRPRGQGYQKAPVSGAHCNPVQPQKLLFLERQLFHDEIKSDIS